MTQSKAKPSAARSAKNTLNDLGYKIFLDRYAVKDMTRSTLKVGDRVIVLVNPATGQREVGTVTAMALPNVTVELLDGTVTERTIEQVDKPLETEPGQMLDRVARGLASVEKTAKARREWQEKFRWLLDDFKFVPAGRILAAAGTDAELTFYNCMPPEQEVLTADGYKPIAEIAVGDLVVTHKHRLRPVLHRFERDTSEPLYSFGVKKIGYDLLRVTGEHKVYALRNGSSTPEWIPAHELRVGDYLAEAYDAQRDDENTWYAFGIQIAAKRGNAGGDIVAVRLDEVARLPVNLAVAFLNGVFEGADSRLMPGANIVLHTDDSVQITSLLHRLGFAFTTSSNMHGERLIVMALPTDETLECAGSSWLAIDSIRVEPYAGVVMDIEVAEDHSFVSAGVVVSNCYVIPSPRDSRGGIIETLRQMTEIMSRGGGVGINISSLRPHHAYVKGVNGRSSGAVSWGALYSFVTGLIEQGGSRRGALMLILDDWHPDVFNFINSKREAGKITNANISVGISDRLMEAVKADGDWELKFPDTTSDGYDEHWDGDIDAWIAAGRPVVHYRTIKARELWNAIIESAWASAEPGVFFRERYNKMSNSHYYAPIISTNPCGEQGLPGFGVCNLGAINLARFYDEERHDVLWDDLDRAVRYATRFLDNVVEVTPYFFEQNERQQKGERRVGLNNMGLAELMIRLGIRYGSDESLAFIDRLYGFIARASYETSIELAQERGSFPMFNAEQFLASGFMQTMPTDIREKVRRHGIRNVTLLTQAPTGTTGTMVNTSTGIEPFFSWKYYRKSRLGLHEENAQIVQDWFDAHPGETELPDYFVTAMELTPEEHVRVQAAIQRWVDSSISKTANVPNHYTVEQTRELYEYMYELGCKGGTIYRDGSRDEQVLMLKVDDEKKAEAPKAEAAPVAQVATPHRVYPRPNKLQGVTVNTNTPYGTAYITMNSDEQGNPFEVFIVAPGKAGSDLQADAEGLGRMISLQLRTTAPENRLTMLRLIIDQLQGIGGSRSVGFGANRIMSLPDAVAQALMDNYFPEDKAQQLSLFQAQFDTPAAPQVIAPASIQAALPAPASGRNGTNGLSKADVLQQAVAGNIQGAEMCPSCHNVSLVRAEGCKTCLRCGFSEC